MLGVKLKAIGDQAFEPIKHLAVDIGCRPIGSISNLVAADYIREVLTKSGLAVEEQELPGPDGSAEHPSLQLNGEMLEASANTFSADSDISAATIAVCTLVKLESVAMTDKVLIFYGDMAQDELAPKGGIYVLVCPGSIRRMGS
jgi:hypothetical protein